jgi:hypothetical protein
VHLQDFYESLFGGHFHIEKSLRIGEGRVLSFDHGAT